MTIFLEIFPGKYKSTYKEVYKLDKRLTSINKNMFPDPPSPPLKKSATKPLTGD
jgi:hypothetical protein